MMVLVRPPASFNLVHLGMPTSSADRFRLGLGCDPEKEASFRCVY
jgi:hypothetical protein